MTKACSMTHRERALQIIEGVADRLAQRVELLGPELGDIDQYIGVATVLALADISEWLENLEAKLEDIAYGIGCG